MAPLDEALFLDGAEQAVENACRLLDRVFPEEGALPPAPFENPGVLQLPERVTHRMAAYAIFGDELPLRRNTVGELEAGQEYWDARGELESAMRSDIHDRDAGGGR